MKKLLATLIIAATATPVFAQIEKGTYVPSFSMNGNYRTQPNEDTASITSNINWSLGGSLGTGVFIKDNLLLSGSVNYTHSFSDTKFTEKNTASYFENHDNKSISNTEGLSVGLTRYKFFTENFAFRYGISAGINYSEANNSVQNYIGSYYMGNATYTLQNKSQYSNSIIVNANLLAGISYFVSKNLAINGSMGFFSIADTFFPYEKKKYKEDTHSLTASLTPSFNAFTVGITYYIRPGAAVAK